MGSQLTERNIITALNAEGVVTREELGQDLLTEEILLHLVLQDDYQDPLGEIVEEAVKKEDLDHVLNLKDNQGNTVLHIATANKLFSLVELVLAWATTTMDVNVNGKEETALDKALPSDTNHKEIRPHHLETGAQEGHVCERKDDPSTTSYKSLAHSSMETKGVLLVVLVLFAGASLSIVSNPPALVMDSRQRVFDGAAPAAFSFGDVITGYMPASFYFLVGSTAVFATSMGAIAVVLCFLPCTVVSQFAGLTVLMLYILLVDKAMPRYTVKIGSWIMSGSVFVWLTAVALIWCGLTVVAVLNSVASFVFDIATALKKRK